MKTVSSLVFAVLLVTPWAMAQDSSSRSLADLHEIEAAERANRLGVADSGSDFRSPSIMDGSSAMAAAEPGGWIAGAGVYYLQPHWGNNPAYQTLISTATASANIQNTSQQDFDLGGQFAPYAWVGYVGPNGFGIRGRYWHMSGSTSTTTSPDQTDPTVTGTIYSAYPLGIGFAAQSATGVANSLEFDSNLTMDVTDLEFIWEFHPGRGSLILGAGLRYAQLSQQYNANWTSTPAATPLATSVTTLSSAQIFDGIGPVVSLEARYPIAGSGFSILGSARGSLLIGTGNQQVAMNQLQNDSTGALAFQDTTTGAQNMGGLMPVLEGEIGAQWEHRMGQYRLFVEAAAVGQAWFSAGNAANSNSMLGIATPSDSTTFRETMGVIGGRVAFGLSY